MRHILCDLSRAAHTQREPIDRSLPSIIQSLKSVAVSGQHQPQEFLITRMRERFRHNSINAAKSGFSSAAPLTLLDAGRLKSSRKIHAGSLPGKLSKEIHWIFSGFALRQLTLFTEPI